MHLKGKGKMEEESQGGAMATGEASVGGLRAWKVCADETRRQR